MSHTRRQFLATASAVGTITLLPFQANAAAHAGGDAFETPNGPVTIHPIDHASIVMETPVGTIYIDPVGDMAAYEGMPAADLILITHEHGDHYSTDLLNEIVADETLLIANPAVFDMLPEDIKAKTTSLANGENGSFGDLMIEAIPAYNLTPERANFHPEGRDNGYVLNFEGFRVYVSGDTEDVPEMRALENIDVAFVSMNLPFTMDIEAAASAVSEFAPSFVYPYHYRGRDGGTQDPREFAALIEAATEVKLAPWYGDEIMPS